MKNAKVVVPIILVLVGLGVGFLSGYEYHVFKLKKQIAINRGIMRNGVFGTILSIDANGITLKLNDGSSKIVLFSSSTTFSNTVAASQSDLKTGANIAVFGATNSDGSVTATSVQINPQFGSPRPSGTPVVQ